MIGAHGDATRRCDHRAKRAIRVDLSGFTGTSLCTGRAAVAYGAVTSSGGSAGAGTNQVREKAAGMSRRKRPSAPAR